MNKPRKQHYLPKSAHLKNFTITNSDEQIWIYRRGHEPYKQNIKDAAAVKDLYSQPSQTDELDFTFEHLLCKEIESPVQKLMDRLLLEDKDFFISEDEKIELSKYIAMLRYRTLTFRRVLCDIKTGSTKSNLKNLAQDKEKFTEWFSNMCTTFGFQTNGLDSEKIRSELENGFWMGFVDGPIILKGITSFADMTVDAIKSYGIQVFECDGDIPLYTCDNPVSAFNIPPFFNKADPLYLRADNFALSISTTRNLLISKKVKDPLKVNFRKISNQANLFNKSTLVQADQFIMSSTEIADLREVFDKEESRWKQINIPKDYRPKPTDWKK